MARSRPHTPALVRDAAVVARPFARATRATRATFARAMASDGAGEAPRKLPKLTFKLKLSAAATARRDDGEDARRGKRRREDDETSEDDRRMRELKMKAARLSRMLPNGEVAGTRGGADGGDERDGSERVIERAAPSGAPSGLSRGTAPRAAIFDHVGFREGWDGGGAFDELSGRGRGRGARGTASRRAESDARAAEGEKRGCCDEEEAGGCVE